MKTWITAHSGADGTADNSMAYLHYALPLPADAVEIDVRKVSGQLLLTHNPVEESGDDVFPYGCVTLREAFTLLREYPHARYNCDLKEDGLEADVYALAKELQVDGQILFSGSVSIDRMRAAALSGKAEVVLNIEEVIPELKALQEDTRMTEEFMALLAAFGSRAAIIAHESGIRTLNVNKLLVTDAFLAACQKEGIGLSVWTVDAGEEAQRFLNMKVSNITTRDLKALLAQRG